MYCRICGDENNVSFAGGNRGFLCPSCKAETPAKVGFDAFCRAYFKGDDDCPDATKREFYDDYRASTNTLADYMRLTTFATM